MFKTMCPKLAKTGCDILSLQLLWPSSPWRIRPWSRLRRVFRHERKRHGELGRGVVATLHTQSVEYGNTVAWIHSTMTSSQGRDEGRVAPPSTNERRLPSRETRQAPPGASEGKSVNNGETSSLFTSCNENCI